METFDVAKVEKAKGFQKFLYELRDKDGGLIICLIIPPSFKDLMLNPTVQEGINEEENFYLYGWYNQHSFPIYIDKSLTDHIYIIGNTKAHKVVVHNG